MECHLLKQSACFISFQTREGLGARKFSFCIGIEFVLYYHSTERETQKEKKKKKKKKGIECQFNNLQNTRYYGGKGLM